MENTNWEIFKCYAIRCLKLRKMEEIDDDQFNNALVDETIKTAEESMPRVKGWGKNVPWWNKDCSKTVKARNKAFKDLKKCHSQHTLIEYKSALAVVRKTIKARKRNVWREYCNSIGRSAKLSDVWGLIRRMGGIRRNDELSVLNSGDTVAINNLEKLNF